MPMRYEIEEIIAQWENGVIYLARDPEDRSVALRRLMLPPNTLFAMEENSIFDRLLAELKGFDCQSLRPVTDGGRDEVDRVPWLTEVLPEGESLDTRLEAGDLSDAEKQALWDHGNHVISQLGDRAGFLSFHPRDIILSRYDDGSIAASFCLDYRDFFIARAAKILSGKKKDPVLDLRNLVSGPPAPASTAPQPVARKPVGKASLASANSGGGAGLWVVIASLVFLVGAGIFYLKQKKESPAPLATTELAQKSNPPTMAPTAPSDDQAPADAPATEEAIPVARDSEQETPTATETNLGDNIFHANDMARLEEKKGNMVTIQGHVQGVSASNTNKTVYVNFGWAKNFVNGEILLAESGGATLEDFTPFKNKNVRITGVVQKNFRQQIIIKFSTLNAIEILPKTKK